MTTLASAPEAPEVPKVPYKERVRNRKPSVVPYEPGTAPRLGRKPSKDKLYVYNFNLPEKYRDWLIQEYGVGHMATGIRKALALLSGIPE